ncbi:MAG: TetR/AcrR family transcriptional regulator [Actinomycetia bacterium]|nr:TetR/AcrR family transcriptional regulator [Actinomycetes bacterium]
MTRRRGRPSKAEGPVIRRSDLLGVAARVIGRDGLAKASMRGIAREAGVSLGTLQNHFPTKETLWKAVIDELIAPAEVKFHEASDPTGLVTEVVRHRLTSAIHRPGLAGRLLTNDSVEGEVVLDYLAEATQEGRAVSRQLLERAMEVGLLRRVDPDAMLAILGVALPALASSKNALHKLLNIDLDDDTDRERLALALSDILLHGLLPRDPRGDTGGED